MPKFAANLSMMFNEIPFPERFATAKEAGFKGVEFLFPYDYPAEEIAKWLKTNSLENALFNLPPGNWAEGDRGMASIPGREEEFRQTVVTALYYAKALGTPTLHVMAGLFPKNADRAKHHATYVENLRYAAKEVKKHGKTLVIEPLNPRDMPDYFLSSQAQAHAICKEVGEDNLKVQMDFYHAQIVEGDLSTTFKRYFSNIGHIQITSVPDRHEPDEGEINYRHIFQLIDKLGYQGWVGCEYRPRANTLDGLGWLDSLKQSM